MSTFNFIDKYHQKRKKQKLTKLEELKRINELSKTIDRIVNINLFNNGKIKKGQINIDYIPNDDYFFDDYDEMEHIKLQNAFNRIVNIKLFDKPVIEKTKPKIAIIDKINIDKMNAEQLKNTYLFIKKSIKDSEQKNRTEEIEQLKKLKERTKKLLLEKSNNLDFNSIKYNIMYGDNSKLDYYRDYLLGCYNKYKDIKYDEEAQKIRITILTLLKLIEIKKQKINQFVKKVK